MAAKLHTIDFVAVAALGCYGLAVLPFAPSAVAHVAGTVLCFALTGIALAIAILPRDASSGARYVGMAACSLSAGIVGGLIVNLFPSGLVRFSWVTFALAATLIACGVARARGAGGSVQWKRPVVAAPSWASCAKVLASVVVVTAAIVMSHLSKNVHEKSFTELWLVPDNQDESPLHATHALLGIKSHETATEDFTIVLDTSKQTMTTRVTLAPNEVWTQVVPVEGPKTTASVYRGGITNQPYRTVWINSE
jgi:hypothetical protein